MMVPIWLRGLVVPCGMPYADFQSGARTSAGKKTAEEFVMTTRRHFLKGGAAAAATGIAFCSCGLLRSAHAQAPARQKLPVTVGGKRQAGQDHRRPRPLRHP
jgi:hypothetical protein